MSLRSWAVAALFSLVVLSVGGCGSSNQPQGSSPPVPTAEERAKLKADPSEKSGSPVSGKTTKARRSS